MIKPWWIGTRLGRTSEGPTRRGERRPNRIALKRSLPKGHWYTGLFLGSYGESLLKLERYADAETALLEAYGILEAALGAVKSLVDLYDACGKFDKATEWMAKLPEASGKLVTSQPATRPATQPVTES